MPKVVQATLAVVRGARGQTTVAVARGKPTDGAKKMEVAMMLNLKRQVRRQDMEGDRARDSRDLQPQRQRPQFRRTLQEAKQRIPSPTIPKPFRLRTQERAVLKARPKHLKEPDVVESTERINDHCTEAGREESESAPVQKEASQHEVHALGQEPEKEALNEDSNADLLAAESQIGTLKDGVIDAGVSASSDAANLHADSPSRSELRLPTITSQPPILSKEKLEGARDESVSAEKGFAVPSNPPPSFSLTDPMDETCATQMTMNGGIAKAKLSLSPDTLSSVHGTALSPDASSPNVDTTCSSTRTGTTTASGSCSATKSGSGSATTTASYSTTTASCSTTTARCGAATSLPINATTSLVNNLAASPAMFRTQIMRCFGIDEIMAATNNFSCDNLLGRGAYGKVYRGQFVDGEVVAVKKLKRAPERLCDFFLEYGILAHLHHPNILTLLGSCHEEGLHLVLQFASRGSLASLIRNQGCSFGWEHRYKVALGVAKGLLYLHQGCRRRVIHMDIKPENIVVGEDYEPKISDFGSAVWLPHGESHIVDAKFRSTPGYMRPEYLHKGIIWENNDVYAFGVLLLELLSGRRASAGIALFQNGKVRDLIDPRLGNSYSMEQATKIMKVALMCTKYIDGERLPAMDKVVQLLSQ